MKNIEKKDLDYETELLEMTEDENYTPSPIDSKRKKSLKRAAAETLEELDKKRQISINLSERDLNRIRLRARAVSIPYQNIIQALLRKYASGEIKLEI
ncbi:hypothetical protein [Nitratifractor sp.]|uniref:hypothetical protein n=1 Tax=Nitratifractor sp. TaxID=2268144 RepID=UPI0025EDFAC9|nr:hypothetical protein [Nitratifractor sp.]